MHTISEHTKRVAALVPATRTADTSSEPIVDTKGFNDIMYVVQAGDGTFGGGTPETYSFQIYESASADGSSPVAITGAVVAITADNQVKDIQISGLGTGSRLRYQFCDLDVAGSSPSLPCSVLAVLDGARGQLNPADAPDASV